MKKTGLILFLVLMLSVATPFQVFAAESNPFFASKPSRKQAISIHYPVPVKKFIGKIAGLQHHYVVQLSSLTKGVKAKNSLKTFAALLVIAFIYGVIHALGPGHGKTLICSYFLSDEMAKWKKGLLLGILIALLHGSSALIIVLALNFIVKHSFLTVFEDISSIITQVSSILIIILGFFLFASKIVKLWKSKEAVAVSQDDRLQGCRKLLPIAFSIGLIPCPGALFLLLFSLSLNLLSVGIFLVLFMTLGMAVTISVISILSIITKRSFMKLFQSNRNIGKKRDYFENIAGFTGSFIIVLLGFFLLITTL